MIAAHRFTSSDLALMPDDGKRYEVIDGELYVTHQHRLVIRPWLQAHQPK